MKDSETFTVKYEKLPLGIKIDLPKEIQIKPMKSLRKQIRKHKIQDRLDSLFYSWEFIRYWIFGGKK